jgi:hypothetical protein
VGRGSGLKTAPRPHLYYLHHLHSLRILPVAHPTTQSATAPDGSALALCAAAAGTALSCLVIDDRRGVVCTISLGVWKYAPGGTVYAVIRAFAASSRSACPASSRSACLAYTGDHAGAPSPPHSCIRGLFAVGLPGLFVVGLLPTACLRPFQIPCRLRRSDAGEACNAHVDGAVARMIGRIIDTQFALGLDRIRLTRPPGRLDPIIDQAPDKRGRRACRLRGCGCTCRCRRCCKRRYC